MKKILLFIIISVFAVSSVMATAPTCESYGYDRTKEGAVGSPDEECQEAGFDFGIVKWECDGGTYSMSEEGVRSGYSVSISGDCSSATWTSTPGADGVLSKEGNCYQDLAGGTSGTVTKLHYDISHITLCGNEPQCTTTTTSTTTTYPSTTTTSTTTTTEAIPEFTAITAGFTALGFVAYSLFKRKK
ncbi:hypothetical protein JW930_01125 [Candidatus Woesearchaeota archaeon]|nr:hypothetical protein [Candidatus Woesearchaeota archaeon]